MKKITLLVFLTLLFGKPVFGDTYTLITNVSDLVAGSKYLIVSAQSGTGYVLGYQNSNNRPQTTTNYSISSGTITATPATVSTDTSNPYEITLNGSTGAWTLYDAVNGGYLYAGSSSKNYLLNQSTSSTWNITFSSNAAVLTSNYGVTNNLLRYNSSSSLFSCYNSGQAAVYLYKKTTSTPTIILNKSSLTGFTYVYGNGPSTEQSFTASATNLTANLTLTAPADFEISTTSGSGFESSLSLTPTSGSIAGTTIYTRLKTGLAVGSYNSETITAASSGATSKTVTCSGTVTCTASAVSFASSAITKNAGDASFVNTFSSNSSGTVNYASSNTSVATVSSDGTVTIYGGGTTTITATQAAAGNYCSNTATYTLNVRSISVSPASLSFSSNAGTTSASQSVTVTGTQLSAAPTYAITGTDATLFAASGSLTTGGGTINVTFTPTSIGSKTATLTITGESGNIVKTVTLTGTGSLAAPTATEATSASTSGFTANWGAVTGAGCYKLDVYTKNASFATDLFISEYIEGSGNNKYIEIFNGTGNSIDLSNYKLQLYANGSTSAGSNVTLSGILANGATIVYKNSSATIYSGSATANAAVGFNGNDAIALFKISTSTFVDIFGRIGEDPGTAWTSGSYSTADKTLVRKSSVLSGVSINPTSGFPTLSTEWDVYNTDVVSYLGSHTLSGAGNSPIGGSPFTITAPSTSYSPTGLTAGTTYYYTVKATDCSATTSSASNEISVTLLSGPSISVSPSSVSGMDYAYEDGPSPVGTFDVAGYSLSGNITVTAPTDFEVSLDGSVYSSVLTLPATGGTVYVRLKAGLSIASYTENLTLVSGSASAMVTLDGNVIAGQISLNDVLSDSSWTMTMPETGTLKIYEQTTGSGYADELFFSKYLEGQGNNKLLEIYNGTQNTINDLSVYSVKVFQNGGGTAINWVTGTVKTYTLSGSLEPGESKVIFTRSTTSPVCSNFDSSWQEFTITNPLQFNGNDPVILVKTIGGVATTIDVIGQTEGTTPTSYWGDASLNTLRVFLVRNNTVKSGANAVAANTTSFNTLTTEWTMQTDIDEGTSGTSTCDAISDFGSYDYNATYGSWNLINGAVSNTNQVTISDASARPCELLKAEITDASDNVLVTNTFRIPIMIKDSKLISDATSAFTTDVCSDCDIAILNGGTLLSSSSGNRALRNAYVLAGGKMDITNGSWAVHNLILKAGYSGNLYNSFPTSSLKINNSLTVNGILRYIRTFDDTQWYFISFPYDVKISDITSPDPSFGAYNYTNWFIKYWDGQSRATNRTASGNWKKYIPGDAVYNANNGYLKANVGYNFGLKSGIKEVVFPFSINNVIAAETSKTISLTAFVKGDGTSDPYSDGWNMVGLPFFSKFDGNGSNLHFFYLSDGGSSKTYTYFDPDDLTGTNALNPFVSYYVQADNTLATSGATFNLSSRRLLPAVDNDLQEKDKVRVFYSSATGEDYMNLVLSDNEDSNYKIGSDLVKWTGTGTPKPQIYATQGGFDLAVDAVNYMQATNIPVTVYNQNAGRATFKANAVKAPNLSQLILTDKEKDINTDLLVSDYVYDAAAGSIANRFTLSAVNKVINSNNNVTGNESFTINLSNDNLVLSHLKDGCNVRLFDIAGKLVFNGSPSVDVMNIHLPVKGVYTLSVSSATGVYSRKIVSL